MAMLERSLRWKTPLPLVHKMKERVEVAQVMFRLTMVAEGQRGGK